MGLVNQQLQSIKPSASIALAQKARQLKAEGRPIISLGIGEPDFSTPDWVCEAAIESMKAGETKYPPIDGILRLKEAIQRKFSQENNIDVSMDQILVSNGGKQAIYNAFMASIDPEDEVILPAPYWVSYPAQVKLAGGHPVRLPCLEKNGFKLTPELIQSAIGPKTKWIVLNSPSNPAGTVYTRAELEAIGDVLRNYSSIYIMTDDIYEHILYTDEPFVSFAEACPELMPRILTINGVSKAYAMTGWRIGYVAGPEPLIRAMRTIQSQSTSGACSIAQAAAYAALTGPQDIVKERCEIFRKRRDLAVEAFNKTPGLSCISPGGAFYVYVNCKDVLGRKTPEGEKIQTDTDFTEYLLDQANVAVITGAAFGLSPYFRASYALGEEDLLEACRRIHQAVEALK